ncbi:hypothetical protein ACRRTK_002479 [Alexandromys fortis]
MSFIIYMLGNRRNQYGQQESTINDLINKGFLFAVLGEKLTFNSSSCHTG